MSVDLTFYVGPYLECKYHQVDTVQHLRTCSNRDCSQHSKTQGITVKFCPTCGSPVQNDTSVNTKVRSVDWYDFTEAIKKELALADPEQYMEGRPAFCDLFIPNTAQGFCVFVSGGDGDYLTPLNWADSVHLSQAFATRYTQEIAEAGQWYDEAAVRFGVLVWRQ